MQDFKQLKIWEKSHRLTLSVYGETKHFPTEELYGLTSQIRRASASIPANIAEGCGRNTPGDQARFFQIAFGSANEVEYFLLLSRDLGFLPDDVYDNLQDQLVEIKRMLTGLLKKVTQRG